MGTGITELRKQCLFPQQSVSDWRNNKVKWLTSLLIQGMASFFHHSGSKVNRLTKICVSQVHWKMDVKLGVRECIHFNHHITTAEIYHTHSWPVWRSNSVVHCMNEVTQHWAQLILGWILSSGGIPPQYVTKPTRSTQPCILLFC